MVIGQARAATVLFAACEGTAKMLLAGFAAAAIFSILQPLTRSKAESTRERDTVAETDRGRFAFGGEGIARPATELFAPLFITCELELAGFLAAIFSLFCAVVDDTIAAFVADRFALIWAIAVLFARAFFTLVFGEIAVIFFGIQVAISIATTSPINAFSLLAFPEFGVRFAVGVGLARGEIGVVAFAFDTFPTTAAVVAVFALNFDAGILSALL